MKIYGAVLAIVLGVASLGAQNRDSTGVKPDNTKVNQQDRAANQAGTASDENHGVDARPTHTPRA